MRHKLPKLPSLGKGRRRRLMAGVASASGLVLILVLILPALVPAEVVMSRVQDRVREGTGRELAVAGGVSFSLFPAVGFEARQVTLSNAPGGRAPALAAIEKIEMGVALLPLLKRKVKITKLVLHRPVLALEDLPGGGNWVFKNKTASERKGVPETSFAVEDIRLEGIRIVDGKITHANKTGAEDFALEQLDLSMQLESLDHVLELDGSARVFGQDFVISFTGGPLRTMMEGRPARAALNINSRTLGVDFAGDVFPRKGKLASGRAEIMAPDLPRLAQLVSGSKETPSFPLKKAVFEGPVDVTDTALTFRDATFRLDEVGGSGTFGFIWGRQRPGIGADIKTGKLVVDRFLGAPARSRSQKGEPWETTPYDFTALRAFDAEITIRTSAIVYRGLETGPAQAVFQLKNGDLRFEIPGTDLLTGLVTAVLRMDVKKPVPSLAFSLRGQDINVQPFMRNLFGVSAFHGTLGLDTSLSAQGRSQYEMVSALQGRGGVVVRDGKIEGISLGHLVERYSKTLLSADSSAGTVTEFSSLGGTFAAERGLISSNTLRLRGENLDVKGSVNISVPDRMMSMVLNPELSAIRPNPSTGKPEKISLKVPLIIEGRFGNLQVRPDLAQMAGEALLGQGGYKDGAGGVVRGAGDKVQKDLEQSREVIKRLFEAFGDDKKEAP